MGPLSPALRRGAWAVSRFTLKFVNNDSCSCISVNDPININSNYIDNNDGHNISGSNIDTSDRIIVSDNISRNNISGSNISNTNCSVTTATQ